MSSSYLLTNVITINPMGHNKKPNKAPFNTPTIPAFLNSYKQGQYKTLNQN